MSIWNEIEKLSKRIGKRNAIGEAVGDSVVFRSYEKLMDDALAAAVLLCERGAVRVKTTGLSAYNTALLTLAASKTGLKIILCDGNGEEKGILLDGARGGFIPEEELAPMISGVLSSTHLPDLPPPSGDLLITFSEGVTYSEEAALLSARAFAEGCALLGSDRLMYLPPVHSPEGLFCGILAPLTKGASSIKCGDPFDMLRGMKLTSPTKLFCGQTEARALLLKLLRIKRLRLREMSKAETDSSLKLLTDPTWVAIRRLISPKILYALGGKLKAVIVLGELSPQKTRAFFSFGIFAITVLSEKGLCPALFHYGGDKRNVWRLPRNSLADICRAEKGGIGKIIISCPAIREGECLDSTYTPLEKRSDGEISSLVTTLSGYILKDGSVFITK